MSSGIAIMDNSRRTNKELTGSNTNNDIMQVLIES